MYETELEKELEKKRQLEKKQQEETIHADILKDVEAGLARPGKAFLKAEVLKEYL